jgi:hypothetical protein
MTSGQLNRFHNVYLWVLRPVAYLSDSLWRRQSQQSFNTLTPFNFLFYSLYVSAPTGHPQVRFTISYYFCFWRTILIQRIRCTYAIWHIQYTQYTISYYFCFWRTILIQRIRWVLTASDNILTTQQLYNGLCAGSIAQRHFTPGRPLIISLPVAGHTDHFLEPCLTGTTYKCWCSCWRTTWPIQIFRPHGDEVIDISDLCHSYTLFVWPEVEVNLKETFENQVEYLNSVHLGILEEVLWRW